MALKPIAVVILILQITGSIYKLNKGEKGKEVFFWIDTWCENCDIYEKDSLGKYFIISEGILKADFDDAKLIVESFKIQLQTEFKNPMDIENSCVFRFKEVKEEAFKYKKLQLTKMDSLKYSIITLPFYHSQAELVK